VAMHVRKTCTRRCGSAQLADGRQRKVLQAPRGTR